MSTRPPKLKILFLCTGNSCRSQMAEGWARRLKGDTIAAWSAGVQTHGLNPRAVAVMAEAGVDISGQRSKHADELRGLEFDWVVTVCDHAQEQCPVFPGQARRVHRAFDDPPRLAAGARDEEEALAPYRRVRDEIRAFVAALPGSLSDPAIVEGPGAKTAGSAPEEIRRAVRENYGRLAAGGSVGAGAAAPGPGPEEAPAGGCCGGGTAGCGGAAGGLSRAIGYADSELAALPAGADMGLSCGNPLALAGLRPGETVVDLGAGAGFDAFLAGPRVGAAGRVIGVDMTPEMVAKARANLAQYRARTGLDNVEFRLGEIEHLPAADASADAVISNCVLNLSPDKPQVWREIARVLKPGGRVAISDIALLRPLPPAVAGMVEALVGCVAGAAPLDDIRRWAAEAGLAQVTLEAQGSYLDALAGGGDPLYARVAAALPAGTAPADYITSVRIGAVKPGGAARRPEEGNR